MKLELGPCGKKDIVTHRGKVELGMKVIGAGFGRTGTTSLKEALEILLDAKCYHFFELLNHRDHWEAWRKCIEDGEDMDFEWLFQGYEGCLDFPCCVFYKEIMKTFPDAKVVLTVRDPKKWFQSWLSVSKVLKTVRHMGSVFPVLNRVAPWAYKVVIEDTFGGVVEEESNIRTFNEHIENVKKNVPEEKLLVYSVTQGWEPLCKFLDLPVPDRPFPFQNAGTAHIWTTIRQGLLHEYRHLLIGIVVALLAVFSSKFVSLPET